MTDHNVRCNINKLVTVLKGSFATYFIDLDIISLEHYS